MAGLEIFINKTTVANLRPMFYLVMPCESIFQNYINVPDYVEDVSFIKCHFVQSFFKF